MWLCYNLIGVSELLLLGYCYCLSLLLPRALKESGLDDSIKVVERNEEDKEKRAWMATMRKISKKERNKAAGGGGRRRKRNELGAETKELRKRKKI